MKPVRSLATLSSLLGLCMALQIAAFGEFCDVSPPCQFIGHDEASIGPAGPTEGCCIKGTVLNLASAANASGWVEVLCEDGTRYQYKTFRNPLRDPYHYACCYDTDCTICIMVANECQEKPFRWVDYAWHRLEDQGGYVYNHIWCTGAELVQTCICNTHGCGNFVKRNDGIRLALGP